MHSFRSGGAISQALAGTKTYIYHAAGILEAAQHRLEVHAFNAGGGTRLGIPVDDQRDLRGTIPAHQRIPSE